MLDVFMFCCMTAENTLGQIYYIPSRALLQRMLVIRDNNEAFFSRYLNNVGALDHLLASAKESAAAIMAP